MHQKHLNHKTTINLGSYYTNDECVKVAWNMIDEFLTSDFTILDSSCGYGNFLNNYKPYKQVGADIDNDAIQQAQNNIHNAKLIYTNSLNKVSRFKYGIGENDKLAIIGNPPYNDKNSIIRNTIKNIDFAIDDDIKTRDLGLSFLLSYNKLDADIVCVLHPLSYLIKKTNFNLIKEFSNNYKLLQAQIISSSIFANSSKSMSFPIVIALYKKDNSGMNYDYIRNFNFKIGPKSFILDDFDYINNYVSKYPNKYQKPQENDILFWTMRDVNALKRNRTFIDNYSYNTIIIDKTKLDYYVYIDVFKEFSTHIPYYLGNCDVIIDNELFLKYKKYFILECLVRNKNLRKYFPVFDFNQNDLIALSKIKIKEYLKKLLGEHYAN